LARPVRVSPHLVLSTVISHLTYFLHWVLYGISTTEKGLQLKMLNTSDLELSHLPMSSA
jgi:hypothetical protein